MGMGHVDDESEIDYVSLESMVLQAQLCGAVGAGGAA